MGTKTRSAVIPLTKEQRAEFLEPFCTAESEEDIQDQPQVAVCEAGADMDFEWESADEGMAVTTLGMLNGVAGWCSRLSFELCPEGLRITLEPKE